MLTNFISSGYMSDCFGKNVTHIELYMGSVMGVVAYFCLECSFKVNCICITI